MIRYTRYTRILCYHQLSIFIERSKRENTRMWMGISRKVNIITIKIIMIVIILLTTSPITAMSVWRNDIILCSIFDCSQYVWEYKKSSLILLLIIFYYFLLSLYDWLVFLDRDTLTHFFSCTAKKIKWNIIIGTMSFVNCLTWRNHQIIYFHNHIIITTFTFIVVQKKVLRFWYGRVCINISI